MNRTLAIASALALATLASPLHASQSVSIITPGDDPRMINCGVRIIATNEEMIGVNGAIQIMMIDPARPLFVVQWNALHFTYRDGKKAAIPLRIASGEVETQSGERTSVPAVVKYDENGGVTYAEKYTSAKADLLTELASPPSKIKLSFDGGPGEARYTITAGLSTRDKEALSACILLFQAQLL